MRGSERSGHRLVRRLVAVAVLLAARPAAAEWLRCDLPFGDYLNEPVTAVSAPGAGRAWALTTWSYRWQDDQHVRWNSVLYRSRNDGLLWDLAFDGDYGEALPALHGPFRDVTLLAMDWWDAERGWLAGVSRPEPFVIGAPPGDFVFLCTTDGGRTWTETRLPNTDATNVGPGDAALESTQTTTALAVIGDRLFQTVGGAPWTERAGPWPRFHDLQAKGLAAPWYAGDDGKGNGVAGRIYWNGPIPYLTVPGSCKAVAFLDERTGVVASWDGSIGRLHRTDDGGATWNVVLSAPGFVFRDLATEGTALRAVGGGITENGTGAVYVSSKGGLTWEREAETATPAWSVAMPHADRAFAGAVGSGIRFVPDPVGADIDQVRRLLRRAAGLEAGAGTLADAVRAARTNGTIPPSYRPFDDPSGVVVLYNASAPDSDGDGVGDSLQVARHYAVRRGVPDANLLGIASPSPDGFEALPFDADGGRANWAQAYTAVVAPLKERIENLGRASVNSVVLCMGMPYRFAATMPDGVPDTQALDTALFDLWRTDEQNWSSWQPYAAATLNLVARYGMPRFEGAGRPTGQPVLDLTGQRLQDPVYVVARLDGPSLEGVLAMVDNAVFAQQYHGPNGYTGTAYIDTRAARFGLPPYPLDELREWLPRYDDYGNMDRSIAKSILPFEDRGYPWRDEVTSASIGGPPGDEAVDGPLWRDGSRASSAPRAMFYVGWYNYGQYFDAWDWLPGSVGLDFDSASAYAFRGRDAVPYWAPGALANGLTALAGVIAEPYGCHPAPDVLMAYLAKGYAFGEAAMLSVHSPRTAKALFLGDPLYRPFGGTGKPVPIPTLTATYARAGAGWEVRLESDVPVRLTLHYTTDGTAPTGAAPSVAGPSFYARRARFTVPTGAFRYILRTVDPTGRVSETGPETVL